MGDLGLHFYGSIPVNEVGPIMLTSSGYMSDEDDELDEDGNYLDIIQSRSTATLRNT